MLLRFLRAARERRARVDHDATDLSRWMGEDAAYADARSCRAERDGGGDRHWSQVAVEIARRTGYVIGETAADRYAADEPEIRTRHLPRATAQALADIAGVIANLARGRGNTTTPQNVRAWVAQVVEAHELRPDVAQAGVQLVRACELLAASGDACRTALEAGLYPEAAERAGRTLQAFAAALRQPN